MSKGSKRCTSVRRRGKRHTNNKGRRQVKTGGTVAGVRRLARELGVPCGNDGD